MMRLIGAIFVIAATSWAGVEYGRNLQYRIRLLSGIKKIFTEVYSDVEYGACTLKESFERIAVKQETVLERFLIKICAGMGGNEAGQGNMPLHLILSEAVNSELSESSLLPADKEQLIRLGEQLGNNQRKGQLRILELYLHDLDGKIAELQKEQKDKQKISRILGISSGVLIVILLL